MHYKENTFSRTQIPTYNDGCFELFEIKQTNSTYPQDYIKPVANGLIWFKELSVSDKLRFQADSRDIKLTIKIRIPQIKEITSMNVLKIGEKYHKVYNVYHFTNDEEYKETDLTLIDYPKAILESEINEQKRIN